MTTTVGESVRRAQALVASLDYPEAIELLRTILTRAPERRDARSLLGSALFRSRQFSAAEVEFRRLVESDPTDAHSAYNLGIALQEMGRSEEAAAAFESALQARPAFPEAEKRLAQLHSGFQGFQRPMTTVTVGGRVRQAQALVKSLDYPEAIELLTDALGRAPDRRDARSLLGLAYFRSRQYSAAEVEFRRLVESDPTDAHAAYNLGLALQEMGRVEDAGAAFESALHARPVFPEAEKRLAQLRNGSQPPPKSLAQLLDDREVAAPNDYGLAGEVIWAGRPWPVPRLPGIVVLILLLVGPYFVRQLADALPAGGLRELLAQLWRFLAAASVPLIVLLIIIGTAGWISNWIVVRPRRVETTRGILNRRQTVLWYHDVESQVVFSQNLIEMLLGLGSADIRTFSVLSRDRLSVSGYFKPRRPGLIHVGSVPAARARNLAQYMRVAIVWQRRRMIGNFISR